MLFTSIKTVGENLTIIENNSNDVHKYLVNRIENVESLKRAIELFNEPFDENIFDPITIKEEELKDIINDAIENNATVTY